MAAIVGGVSASWLFSGGPNLSKHLPYYMYCLEKMLDAILGHGPQLSLPDEHSSAGSGDTNLAHCDPKLTVRSVRSVQCVSMCEEEASNTSSALL